MVKKLLITIIVIILLFTIGRAAIIRYLAPPEALDLSYTDVSVMEKIVEMVKKRQFAVELTQEDIDNLLKKALARNPRLNADTVVTGARFLTAGNRLTADITLNYKDQLTIGATGYFSLDADRAVLTATYEGAKVKALAIPVQWFSIPPLTVDLNEFLPPLVSIRQIQFTEHGLILQLGGPSFG